MADKPKALRLADVLNHKLGGAADEDIEQAAAELRRVAAIEAERDALKAENERLNGMLSAANWNLAQEEHNALRAERDALVDEKYRLRHLLAQARFFVDRAPHGDERDCPVCEFINRIDAALDGR